MSDFDLLLFAYCNWSFGTIYKKEYMFSTAKGLREQQTIQLSRCLSRCSGLKYKFEQSEMNRLKGVCSKFELKYNTILEVFRPAGENTIIIKVKNGGEYTSDTIPLDLVDEILSIVGGRLSAAIGGAILNEEYIAKIQGTSSR